jgi:hypothetical protein
MEIYHLAMLHRNPPWTVTKTALNFECSVGLVSENLKLAEAFHNNKKLMDCKTRREALKKMQGEKYGRYRSTWDEGQSDME